jgi:type IV pilus assembly protein PilE
VKNKTDGFTLIELMITVVVVIILLAIAVPSYQDFVRKGARADAKSRLLDVAQMQERYISNQIPPTYFAYTSATAAAGFPTFSGDNVNNRKYDIAVSAGATGAITSSYVITASTANNFTDPTCGNLTLDSVGNKTPNNPACW